MEPVTAEHPAAGDDDNFDAHVERVVQRAILRNIPGLNLPQSQSELDVGQTPKELVYSNETARLYHYTPMLDEIYRVPVLIVMSPVAKGYILDLAHGQSLIEYLLMQGHDVYMLDWAAPHREQSRLGLDEYVLDLVGGCVEAVAHDSGEDDITLIGYCMGGMLSLMYTALNVGGPVRNLACFTTPVNGDGMALFKKWMTSKSFDIDRLVDQIGNIPGDMINGSIQALRPLQRSANQMRLLNNVQDDAFVKAHLRFDRWAVDQLPLPGELARKMAKDFIIDNKLIRGGLELRGKPVDFANIRVPFLHVAALYDHIVPAEASRDLIDLVGSEDKKEIVMKGGHVSLVAGGNAIFRLWPQLDAWLAARDQ
ncbi:MAG: alpha/beta fold hydrolase [Gammaproteobacteria bacterium]|nr:alpha/beta fold hydrolase [Gammaproteobacteria bacterium]MCP5198821.1 alpha/beta fold hydrolase [Gammaproteobacteria bacterium]